VNSDFPVAFAVRPCHRHVDRAALGWVGEEFVEVNAGSMAHGGAFTAREHGGHLVGVATHHRADEVDAAMEPAELAPLHHPLHLPSCQPQPHELLPIDRCVLGRRERGNLLASRIESTHTVLSVRLAL
jgi:hypothetical protein